MNMYGSDDEDEAFEVARNQLDVLEQYGAISCAFGTYYADTYLNKSQRRESILSGHDWVMHSLNISKDFMTCLG